MSKKLISSASTAQKAREHSRRLQKRAIFTALCTIALSLLGFSFGIEENGGQYAKKNELPAVFGMDLSGAGGETAATCTAFLVHPELLLTAAHCVYEFSISDISNAPDLRGNTRKYSNPKFKTPVILPSYNRLRPGKKASDPSLMQHDFAYIRLKKPIEGVAPLPIKGLHELPENGVFNYVGRPVMTTGYGVKISRGASGDYSEDSKGAKRYGSGRIEGVSGLMLTLPGLKGNILPGDSGGPLLIQENGTWYVIGVNQSISHGGPGGAYSEGRVLGLRKELVCWASKDSGIAIPGVTCP